MRDVALCEVSCVGGQFFRKNSFMENKNLTLMHKSILHRFKGETEVMPQCRVRVH